MTNRKTSIFENSLIWFGAAVSIAEIISGTYIAPLGFSKGITAIIIGHVIGCILLFLAGVIGGKTGKSSMESTKTSFGQNGSYFFAFLNIIQLAGWTAIMIYDGAIAANSIFPVGQWLWALLIGSLICLWILIGIKNLNILNTIAMTGLFLLTLILSFVVFKENNHITPITTTISFGSAIELSAAMPISWLPLISDYTRDAKKPTCSAAVSSAVYGVISCWMYIIGMGCALFCSTSDIAQIMLKSGMGIAGLLIIVFSTVTTTFLDSYSAGISSKTIINKFNVKWVAVAVTLLGTSGAIVYPMTNITDFLYLIGSVFAPMIAIQITDFFVLKKTRSNTSIQWSNMFIWLAGFIIYRILMKTDIIFGSTLPDILITSLLCLIFKKRS